MQNIYFFFSFNVQKEVLKFGSVDSLPYISDLYPQNASITFPHWGLKHFQTWPHTPRLKDLMHVFLIPNNFLPHNTKAQASFLLRVSVVPSSSRESSMGLWERIYVAPFIEFYCFPHSHPLKPLCSSSYMDPSLVYSALSSSTFVLVLSRILRTSIRFGYDKKKKTSY